MDSPALGSKAWVFRQYDHMVGINTIVRPGADAAVLRIKGTEKIPVVVLSARSQASEVLSGLAVKGVVDYVTKPFDKEDLRKRIREALKIG